MHHEHAELAFLGEVDTTNSTDMLRGLRDRLDAVARDRLPSTTGEQVVAMSVGLVETAAGRQLPPPPVPTALLLPGGLSFPGPEHARASSQTR